jgi:hypothetical protein
MRNDEPGLVDRPFAVEQQVETALVNSGCSPTPSGALR